MANIKIYIIIKLFSVFLTFKCICKQIFRPKSLRAICLWDSNDKIYAR